MCWIARWTSRSSPVIPPSSTKVGAMSRMIGGSIRGRCIWEPARGVVTFLHPCPASAERKQVRAPLSRTEMDARTCATSPRILGAPHNQDTCRATRGTTGRLPSDSPSNEQCPNPLVRQLTCEPSSRVLLSDMLDPRSEAKTCRRARDNAYWASLPLMSHSKKRDARQFAAEFRKITDVTDQRNVHDDHHDVAGCGIINHVISQAATGPADAHLTDNSSESRHS